MKNLLKIIIIMFSSVCYAYGANISIKLVFESGFSNSFQLGGEWENVDETSVKNFIIT